MSIYVFFTWINLCFFFILTDFILKHCSNVMQMGERILSVPKRDNQRIIRVSKRLRCPNWKCHSRKRFVTGDGFYFYNQWYKYLYWVSQLKYCNQWLWEDDYLSHSRFLTQAFPKFLIKHDIRCRLIHQWFQQISWKVAEK